MKKLGKTSGDARKARIVEAAVDVFRRYGFERTKMTDIAKAAGLTRPTLYLTFPAKEDIFSASVETLFKELLEKIAREADLQDSLQKKIESACSTWCFFVFDITLSNPDASDLFDLRFPVVRACHADFEDLLIELIAPDRNDSAQLKYVRAIAHMMVAALKGFKEVATTRDELKCFIADLCKVVAVNLRQGN
ncbi:Transcriptional regulator, TetR family [Acetobacter malorum]|nr:Transcriptional regulator, TetR family [Acetobacter malorum]